MSCIKWKSNLKMKWVIFHKVLFLSRAFDRLHCHFQTRQFTMNTTTFNFLLYVKLCLTLIVFCVRSSLERQLFSSLHSKTGQNIQANLKVLVRKRRQDEEGQRTLSSYDRSLSLVIWREPLYIGGSGWADK